MFGTPRIEEDDSVLDNDSGTETNSKVALNKTLEDED